MDKETLRKFLGNKNMTAVEAMKMIDNNQKGILYVVNSRKQLCGSVSDGDIRRWIIRTGNLEGQLRDIMLKGTRYLNIREQSLAVNMMRMEAINSVPILDDSMKILDIVFIEDVYKPRIHKNTSLKDVPVIVMAGGKGTRLYPYTKILPKPLIPIGDIPILERILDHFRNYGCREFYLTVNYKKEMIRSYFNDLNPPYVIHYVEENKPLGTAGSISLIKEELSGPVIITNCDILIETDYENLLKRHIASDNAMTIVASLQDTVIPYGVIHTSEDGYIETIEEKPRLSYLINTGMYIVDARYLKLIPHDRMYHMTELAEELLRREYKVGTYPVSENSFLDMGQFEELKKMEERITGG